MLTAMMMMQTSIIEVQSKSGVTTRNPFICRVDPPSSRLLVLLPGRGYSCDHPVLYALRAMALQIGYDVLSVQYGFQAANTDLTQEAIPHLQNDVAQAVAPAFERGYTTICIAGKSLGTALAAELARNIGSDELGLIMLTPVAGVMQSVKHIKTLAISGSNDSLHSRDLVALMSKESNIRWRVFDGLDHALEFRNDWRASLAVLPEIIGACEEFLCQFP
jgi:hypothetical protein